MRVIYGIGSVYMMSHTLTYYSTFGLESEAGEIYFGHVGESNSPGCRTLIYRVDFPGRLW